MQMEGLQKLPGSYLRGPGLGGTAQGRKKRPKRYDGGRGVSHQTDKAYRATGRSRIQLRGVA